MKPIMDINQIKATLPHRYPFLLVDKVIAMEPGKKITAIKNVTTNEPFFQGHFPSQPVMPGVLIIEALAQTCGLLALKDEERRGKLAFFASIKDARFRKPVVPGDTLTLDVEITNDRTRIVQCQGYAKVDGEVVAEANMMFAIMGEQG